MKKKITTVVALILCAVLLVAGSVAATLAFLADTSDVVTNTFTVGNVQITLDEAKVNPDGTLVPEADRVIENDYKLIPKQNYIKDPTVHVAEGSEASYLYVVVKNAISDVLVAAGEESIAAQMTANGWTPVAGYTDLYKYNTTVTAGDYEVFGEFTVADVDNAELEDANGKTITIKAAAIQSEGVDVGDANTEAASLLAATAA